MPFFPDPSPPFDYIDTFAPNHPSSIVAEWQRHVYAGRIGTRTLMAGELLANLRATGRSSVAGGGAYGERRASDARPVIPGGSRVSAIGA